VPKAEPRLYGSCNSYIVRPCLVRKKEVSLRLVKSQSRIEPFLVRTLDSAVSDNNAINKVSLAILKRQQIFLIALVVLLL